MARRYGTGKPWDWARKHRIIKEVQAAIARELADQSELPKTVPKRIADLLRELHRRLRNPSQGRAPRSEPQGDCALNQERYRHWGDSARAGDWGSAVVVALVLTVATLIAAIAIAAFDNSARLTSRYNTMSEPSRTSQGGGSPETDGRAR